MSVDMDKTDEVEKLCAVLQTLGDVKRLRILRFIGKKERTVSEIVKATNFSQPLVSHHLRSLRHRRILDTKREGPFIYYKLNHPGLLDLLGLLSELFKTYDSEERSNSMFCLPYSRKQNRKKHRG